MGKLEARIQDQDVGEEERLKLNRARWRLRRAIRRERPRGRGQSATARPARDRRAPRHEWRPEQIREFFEAEYAGGESARAEGECREVGGGGGQPAT